MRTQTSSYCHPTQIFEHFNQGWTILNLVAVAIITVAITIVVLFTGGRPLARRLSLRLGEARLVPTVTAGTNDD
jgi:hypothetical protein